MKVHNTLSKPHITVASPWNPDLQIHLRAEDLGEGFVAVLFEDATGRRWVERELKGNVTLANTKRGWFLLKDNRPATIGRRGSQGTGIFESSLDKLKELVANRHAIERQIQEQTAATEKARFEQHQQGIERQQRHGQVVLDVAGMLERLGSGILVDRPTSQEVAGLLRRVQEFL